MWKILSGYVIEVPDNVWAEQKMYGGILFPTRLEALEALRKNQKAKLAQQKEWLKHIENEIKDEKRG